MGLGTTTMMGAAGQRKHGWLPDPIRFWIQIWIQIHTAPLLFSVMYDVLRLNPLLERRGDSSTVVARCGRCGTNERERLHPTHRREDCWDDGLAQLPRTRPAGPVAAAATAVKGAEELLLGGPERHRVQPPQAPCCSVLRADAGCTACCWDLAIHLVGCGRRARRLQACDTTPGASCFAIRRPCCSRHCCQQLCRPHMSTHRLQSHSRGHCRRKAAHPTIAAGVAGAAVCSRAPGIHGGPTAGTGQATCRCTLRLVASSGGDGPFLGSAGAPAGASVRGHEWPTPPDSWQLGAGVDSCAGAGVLRMLRLCAGTCPARGRPTSCHARGGRRPAWRRSRRVQYWLRPQS